MQTLLQAHCFVPGAFPGHAPQPAGEQLERQLNQTLLSKAICSPTVCLVAAGTVLFYLIRMEPFTAMNRNLQGGRFDHADRLFSNLAATWDNCLHSSSDVKELTPEFYHQSEFLLNCNDFNLGVQQVSCLVSCTKRNCWQ